ncbi:MAG: Gfo/Idh/MocA family oxidoreductase [Bacteroidales bacterium]|nr:Gfo/Idh/MocA family oxidoreductase [Bacteroidales bacterium]MCF8405437.1 Gfo/Idh/MocA family oxidoreductase [Bacteroidales bacterium]
MEHKSNKIGRRDIIKGLATVPVAGALLYGWYRKRKYESLFKKAIQDEVKLDMENPVLSRKVSSEKQIRLGIIGTGSRGRSLLKAAGFLNPTIIDSYLQEAAKNKLDKRYQEFQEQDDLNVVLNGVCDIYDLNAKRGLRAGANIHRNANDGEQGPAPKRYRNYKELLAANDIDAVIIATPDHWHGTITIEAAKAGKHVYCEKPLTWTIPETFEVIKAVKENNIVFQLGHQLRQTESYFRAKEAYEKGLLGKVNLVEVTTNRNSPNGAWVYTIDEEAGPHNIDWEQFLGPAPFHEFSLERFFRWRCWWDYSTGLSGDLFTHEYDAMNQILSLGIPESAISSGGIYYFKDGRTVPDVLQQTFEYPHRDLTLMYSASLASNMARGRRIMGHDAYMEVGGDLKIYADSGSTKYAKKIEEGLIDPNIPIYSFTPGMKQVDAITSATEQYFAGRGLLYTYRGGKRVDTSHLHIKDWLDCIREGGLPSCNINYAFEEAITAHMGTVSYHEGRKVFWDKERQEIV